jgi:hypothetical protein
VYVLGVPLTEGELDELEAWLGHAGTDGAEAARLLASARDRNLVTIALIPEYRDALLSVLELWLEEVGGRGWSRRLFDLRDKLDEDARDRGVRVER